MFRDENCIAFCMRYFESLWTDNYRAIRLRTQAGLRPDGLERIRDQLRALTSRSLVAMDNLHPEIRDRCASLYGSGNYAEAVEKSFKVVRDRLSAPDNIRDWFPRRSAGAGCVSTAPRHPMSLMTSTKQRSS